ncbi:MAG: lysophospholipid acyltransferase family protein [Burkholderiaceae bacterium]
MTFFVQSLFRALSALPLPLLHAFGWLVGWATFAAVTPFPTPVAQQRFAGRPPLRTALASVGESGKMLAETLVCGSGAPPSFDGMANTSSNRPFPTDRGCFSLTPHLGCFEITAQALAARFGDRMPITVLYRPSRQPWLRDLVATARERPHLHTAPTTLAGVKQLIKALKTREAVGLLPDQVPPHGQGVWAPFFGREAYTMTLSARLALTPGVQMVLIWGERLSWGRGYLVHVRPYQVEGGLSKDAVTAAAQINRAMEELVRECPAQYIWSYDRYKNPHGSASPAPEQTPSA